MCDLCFMLLIISAVLNGLLIWEIRKRSKSQEKILENLKGEKNA